VEGILVVKVEGILNAFVQDRVIYTQFVAASMGTIGKKNANSKIGIWIGNKSDDTLELEVCHGMSHFETRSYLGVP
jgi:uncharacterized protein YpmB